MSVFSPFSSLISRRHTRPALAALSIAGLVTVAGCSSLASDKEEGPQTTVSNCRHEVTVDSPPQRVMTMVDPSIGPILTHGAVENTNAVLRAQGVALPETIRVTPETDLKAHAGALVIAPPGES